MDLSGFLLIPVAAVIAAVWIVGAAFISKRRLGFRSPFLLSYGLGVIFMQPWRISTWEHFGMFTIMLVMLVFWVAIGCLIGGLPATLAVSIVRKLRRRIIS
ncbi:hypothetical protein [Sphingobium chungbukense]|uniref:Uncharacterized protein n=1 Tax=Sphingobium chungbukense TaxID=56193 RepID=A0A0M3APV5_9SPHN|nr:hypothetical protein [Sphingobium chungbukense]KKW92202.1 hypothetical protein YP76_09665 [Sphingobium chungbukense]